jgi:hypothetical protein
MSNITTRSNNELTPDLAAKIMSGIAESRATTVMMGGGKPMLRMLKTGEWVYGQGNEEVQEGSRWAVNILSMSHGWVCWEKNEGKEKNRMLGEVMVSMMEKKPACPSPVEGHAYKEQRGFELRCYDGDDAGTEVIHKMTSDGGLKGIDKLLAAIQRQLAADPTHPCPLVSFVTDSYPHPKWGTTYTPTYQVDGWVDMDGNTADEREFNAELKAGSEPAPAPDPDPEPSAPAPVAAPVRTRPTRPEVSDPPTRAARAPAPPLAKAAKAPLKTPVGRAPAPTARGHTGQRRRPVER